MRREGHSALRANNGKIETFTPHAATVSQPLSYEQEVHALLCAAAANTEDLLRYFEAQAANESGEARGLTQRCIDWKRNDLQRIRALIPLALEKRELAKRA